MLLDIIKGRWDVWCNAHPWLLLNSEEKAICKICTEAIERKLITSLQGCDITCTSDAREFFIAHSETKGLCPMYTKFVELLLTIPGSSCTNERSFSLMRRVKTYLRSTMGQQRLNNISILAAYRELSDQTNMDEIVDDFINQNNLRKATFAVSNK